MLCVAWHQIKAEEEEQSKQSDAEYVSSGKASVPAAAPKQAKAKSAFMVRNILLTSQMRLNQ